MAARCSALFICVLFCFSYVRGEDLKPVVETSHEVNDPVPVFRIPVCVMGFICEWSPEKGAIQAEDVKSAVKSLEEHVSKAKEHVDHMFSTSLIPHQEKLHSLVKNESDHLAHELKQTATKLAEVVSVGEHTAAVKDAVLAAVPVLNEAAASLDHTGDDLKQQNAKYYEAASKLLQEAKKIVDVEPCAKVIHVLKGIMFELQYDVDKYQWGIHNEMGFEKADHHVHKHHGASSEESKESSE